MAKFVIVLFTIGCTFFVGLINNSIVAPRVPFFNNNRQAAINYRNADRLSQEDVLSQYYKAHYKNKKYYSIDNFGNGNANYWAAESFCRNLGLELANITSVNESYAIYWKLGPNYYWTSTKYLNNSFVRYNAKASPTPRLVVSRPEQLGFPLCQRIVAEVAPEVKGGYHPRG